MKAGFASLNREAPISWPTAIQRRSTPRSRATRFQSSWRVPKKGRENTTSPSWWGKRTHTSGAAPACRASRSMSLPHASMRDLQDRILPETTEFLTGIGVLAHCFDLSALPPTG